MIFKRKIYEKLLKWKSEDAGTKAIIWPSASEYLSWVLLKEKC